MSSFSFPFKSNNNNKTSPASVEEFFTALSMESDGFYPFGVNEFWHGGIHITSQSNGALKQGDGIQCIADGEVVAYRINEKYIDTPAYEDPTKGTSINIPYSSSFTLVRHTLEYPKNNKLTVFSLYMHLLPWSEYEKDTKKSSPAYFGKINYKVSQRAKDNKNFATTTLGANARLAIDNKIVLSRIPRGSLLELEGEIKKGQRAKIKRIISGTPVKNPDIPAFGYVYIPDLEKLPPSPTGEYAGKPIYKVKSSTTDTETFAAGVVGTRARIHKTGKSKNHVLNLIPKGAELILEDNAGTTGRAEIISIKTGSITKNPAFDALGTVWVNDLDKVTKPASFDKVETETENKDLPKKIKKGDLIGYMGDYCTPEKTKDRPMLHWEVFAGDALNVFITKARANNEKAKKSEKTVLKIPKGTSMIWPHERPADTSIPKKTLIVKLKSQNDYTQCQTLGMSAKVKRSLLGDWSSAKKYYTPKKENYAALTMLLGETVDSSTHFALLKEHKGGLRTILLPIKKSEIFWVKKSISLTKIDKARQQLKISAHAWTKYPEEFIHEVTKTTDRTCMNPSELKTKKLDENNNEWFEIASYDKQMCSVGYINASNLTRHAPEEFICFEGVDIKGGSDASIHKDPDNYWKNLFAPITLENAEDDSDTPINDMRLDVHPFAKKVFQTIDENHDGTVTLQEMKSALSNPIKQKKIATLITKHESEWVKSMERWKYIEKYIPDATRYDWEHEKAKIQKLAWWDDVKGKVTGFPAKEAYYFHPAGFVGNFVGGGCEITSTQLARITGNNLGEKYLKYLNSGRDSFGITSCHDFGHFLAQIIHESTKFLDTKERGGLAYLKAKKYWPYYGRGLIQITWKKNYISYGKMVGENFISSDTARDKLRLPEHAVKSAFWYWQTKGLSAYSELDDFIWITIKVNGGLNGYNDRLNNLNIFKREMSNNKISGKYAFADSKAYHSLRGAYAWGIWSDSGKPHLHGKTKSKVDAKAGYYRTLELLKAGKTVTSKIYGNETTADLKKWATAHLKRLGGTPP